MSDTPEPGRLFDDFTKARVGVYDQVLSAAQTIKPVEYGGRRVEVLDVGYDPADDDDDENERFGFDSQAKAVRDRTTLGRRLRATVRMSDLATGDVLEEQRKLMAVVPRVNEDGTMIYRGSRYNVVNQQRLKPAVYGRVKKNEELEVMANPSPGSGSTHRYIFNPESSVFFLSSRNSKVPLVPLLRALGVEDDAIRAAWGDEIAEKNFAKRDGGSLDKLYERLVPKKLQEPHATPEFKQIALRQAIGTIKLDPWSTKKILGIETDHLTPEVILRSTAKTLEMSRGLSQGDDRDSLAFQTVHGVEDLMAERFRLDSGHHQKNSLRKVLWRGNLKALPAKFLQPHIESTIFGSGLGIMPEYANPLDAWDRASRVTKLGEGGIASTDSVPMESRDHHSSHQGFIDPARTSESTKVGIDVNFAAGARKGPDGKVYTQLINARTGELEFVTPERASEAVVAFQAHDKEVPGYMLANVRGSERFVKPSRVDYIQPDSERSAFSTLSNLTPMKGLQPQNRTAMSARFLSQAVPLKNREAPWVQVAVPGTDRNESFEQHYADRVGLRRAPAGGQVVAVKPNAIQIETPDGIRTVGLHVNTPLGRKTNLVNTSIVQVGDRVEPGQPLATSNYTDQSGTMALGLNARVAYTPWGDNYEDAYTISQSFANRMASEHSYDFRRDNDPEARTSVNDYISALPREYNREQVERMDPDGVVRVGTVVKQGDPLVLSAKRRSANMSKRVSRTGAISFTDDSQQWGHDDPGIVTNVHRTKNGGAVVTVATASPLRDADKLCYSADTEVLTDEGWVFVDELTTDHRVATLLDGVRFDYVNPVAINVFEHSGDMYHAESTQVDLLVTGNHRLYAKPRSAKWAVGHQQISPFDASGYRLIPAEALFGREYRLKRDGVWVGHSPDSFVLEEEVYEQGMRQLTSGLQRTFTTRKSREIPPEVFACILGAFLSEGSLINNPKSGTYGIRIAQHKPQWRQRFAEMLTKWGIKFGSDATGFTILGKQWLQWFDEFTGIDSYTKYIPAYAFSWSTELQRVLLEWMVWGDGHVPDRGSDTYYTSSKRLADDVQRLLLHVGLSGNIKWRSGYSHRIKGVYTECRESYIVTIFASKQHPTINHSHVKKQGAQTEEWSQYEGMVYCPTMPYGNVIYVRRNGKPVWCGNSERGGNKGIVRIIPDDEMLQDQNGQPFDVVASDLGLISRKNDSRAFEALLGKIAAKTGKPYRLEEMDSNDVWQLVRDGLDQNGLSDTETVVDPTNGRKIPNVFTGVQYMLKLQHMAESKAHGRGVGAYSSDGQPAKGAEEGLQAKRFSSQELGAMVSHGAFQHLKEVALVRGQRNDEYWARFINGHDLPEPKVPMVYNKFLAYLKGMGVNPVRTGTKTKLLLLDDQGTGELAEGRTVRTGETVNMAKDLKPAPGGLFDPALFGGDGDKFASYELDEPIPHPMMEDALRTLMGVTKDGFRNILSGQQPFGQHGTGPKAIQSWLAELHPANELAAARLMANDPRKTKREEAIKKMRYLAGLTSRNIKPETLMIRQVPIIPPIFRPISRLDNNNTPLIDGMNLLYRDMIAADENHRKVKQFSSDTSNERLGVYDAVQAAVGLRQPLDPELERKSVTGIMARLVGKGGPKTCYDDKTEILTKRGWLLFADLLESDEVGTLNQETGVFEFQRPTAIHKFPYVGELFHFRNKCTLDLMVTPNHRNWCRKRAKKTGTENLQAGWKIEPAYATAARLSSSMRCWMRTAAEGWVGNDLRPPELAASVPTTDFAEFVGLWAAEGYLFGDGRVVSIGQSKSNEAVVERIRELLNRFGWTYTETDKPAKNVTRSRQERRVTRGQRSTYVTGPAFNWTITEPWLADWLFEHVGKTSQCKKLSRWVLDWNVDNLKAFIAGFLEGDGSKATWIEDRKLNPKHANRSDLMAGFNGFNTSSSHLANQFQEVFIKLGLGATLSDIGGVIPKFKNLPMTRVNKQSSRFCVLDKPDQCDVVSYAGYVYCVTVPNSVVLVRRNRKPVFSGNSFVSRKLLSGTVDSVGRAVIGPDAKLGLDQVGIPEEQAWSIYEAPILRNMTRRGVALAEARESVKRRDKAARQAMEEELAHRPVMVSRAPVLHKYGAMTFWPKLVKGTSLHMNPLVYSGYGADNDGDAVNFHALITEEAIREAKQKTMPSRSLISPKDFKRPMFVPGQDHALGIYLASTAADDDERLHVFADRDAARRAFRRGEISVSSKIKILG